MGFFRLYALLTLERLQQGLEALAVAVGFRLDFILFSLVLFYSPPPRSCLLHERKHAKSQWTMGRQEGSRDTYIHIHVPEPLRRCRRSKPPQRKPRHARKLQRSQLRVSVEGLIPMNQRGLWKLSFNRDKLSCHRHPPFLRPPPRLLPPAVTTTMAPTTTTIQILTPKTSSTRKTSQNSTNMSRVVTIKK